MACLIVVDIEPLLILFEFRETIHENRAKVNRDVDTSLWLNQLTVRYHFD